MKSSGHARARAAAMLGLLSLGTVHLCMACDACARHAFGAQHRMRDLLALPCSPGPGCSLAGPDVVRGARPKSVGPHGGVLPQ